MIIIIIVPPSIRDELNVYIYGIAINDVLGSPISQVIALVTLSA